MQDIGALAPTNQTHIMSTPPPPAALPENIQTHYEMYKKPAKSVKNNQTDILQRASAYQTRELPDTPEELQPFCEHQKGLAVFCKQFTSEDW